MKWLLLWALLVVPAFAVEPSERLPDPALEARARAISSVLRCLVCQNESIDDSGADLAHDIRMLVRQRLAAGDSDQAVIKAVVDRYGQFVLLNPPVGSSTYVLWFGPPAAVLAGLGGVALWLRHRRMAPAEPLSPQEQARLNDLLKETDG